jgi:hypothetical protein
MEQLAPLMPENHIFQESQHNYQQHLKFARQGACRQSKEKISVMVTDKMPESHLPGKGIP